MSKTMLIIGREYGSRVRKKSFLVVTILMPLLIIGLMFLAMWLGLKDDKVYKVLVADPYDWCGKEIAYDRSGGSAPVEFYFLEDMIFEEDFMSDSRYEKYDALIGIDDFVHSNRQVNVLHREVMSARAQSFIEVNVGNRLREHFAIMKGTISVQEYRDIQQKFDFEFKDLVNKEDSADLRNKAGVGLTFSVLIYMFILIYSIQVMRGVIEEKSNRVVEIVVSSVKPFQLMMGKIIGIGLVGLTQFFIWFVLVGVGLMLLLTFAFPDMSDPANWEQVQQGTNMAAEGISTGMESPGQTSEFATLMRDINWGLLLVMFVVYFLGGYLVYASLFAMIGSAVDNEADTQQMIYPVILPLTFSYILATTVIANPMGTVATWFSMIPFTSPIIMLERIAMGDSVAGVTPMEVVVSVLLLIGTSILMVWLAAKTYRVGILMYGKKASWREIIRWMRF